MRVLPKIGTVAAALFVLPGLACQASVEPDRLGAEGGGAAATAGGSGNLAGSAPLPTESQAEALLPARIRRLTVAEYQATVSDPAVVGDAAAGVSANFVPDSRQNGFTVNAAQLVDPLFAAQLADAASSLAASIREHAAERAPCLSPSVDPCAESFIRGFGEKAYRRPLADDEVTQLMAVFRAAFDGGSYEEGIELVARAMLQSASFMYHTQSGEGAGASVKLNPYELASSISYLVQGGPPSALLLDRAKSGQLDTPEGRTALLADKQVALFDGPMAAGRVTRVLREWLGIDKIADIAKDSNFYPEFEGARGAMADETLAFVYALVSQDGQGSLRQLLAADWTMANHALGPVYGANKVPLGATFERLSTPDRLGILNQGAFLSVFAHAQEAAPVLRGVAVMRRVACMALADPSKLGLSVVPPLPDPTKSLRERFAVHSETPGCASCHNSIDNFGFAFGRFDAMGRKDDDAAIDSSVVVTGTDFDGSYADSSQLATALSTSTQVRQCFARQIFRALSATSDPAFRASEDDFVKYWDTTLQRDAGKVEDVYVIGTIGAFLTNPNFNVRRVP
jgi:hypothetical protein